LVQAALPSDRFGRSRRFARYRASLKLRVLVLGAQGRLEITGLCNQLGEGGLGAIIGTELSIGEMVDVQLFLPSETDALSFRAVVRWRDRLQHGFEFFGMSADDSGKIRSFCKTLDTAR